MFSRFSSLFCLILNWCCEKKFCFGHSQELKSVGNNKEYSNLFHEIGTRTESVLCLIQSKNILKIFLKRKSHNLYFKRFFFRCIEWTNWTYAGKYKWFLLTLILPKINFFCYIKYRICQNFRTLWRSCTKWPMKSGPMLLYLITCWTIQAGMTGQQP